VSEVAIFDRVTLPGDEAAAWISRLHDEYAPRARERRMRLVSTGWAASSTAGAVDVCLWWELDTLADFWFMRAGAIDDASVAAWWARTDAIAIARVRQVLAGGRP
jgi:hypothetical protein